MVWQIKPFSHRCFVTEKPFESGDVYISYLVVDAENELQRYDVSEEADEDFAPEGEVLCRWRQVYKKEPEKDGAGKRQRETAEGLFLSLFEGNAEIEGDGEMEAVPAAGEADEEAEILKKFLALLLERKKVLRPRGESSDGQFRLFEHVKTKAVYPVPAGDLGPEEFMRISGRLSELVR